MLRQRSGGVPVSAAVVALVVALLAACSGQPDPAATSPSRSRPLVVAFIGDSYTQGAGASTPARRWTDLVAAKQGWKAINLGRGGTGYTMTSDAQGCGLKVCPNYPSMLSTAAARHPDALVIAGGQNDFSTFNDRPAQEAAAIRATFAEARRALPRAIIIGVGPSTPEGVDDDIRAFAATVEQAVKAVRGRYVSMTDPDVLEGGSRRLMSSDAVHPNDAGHAAIAARFLRQIAPDGSLLE